MIIEDAKVEEYYQAALLNTITYVAQAMAPGPNPNFHSASQDDDPWVRGKQFAFKSVCCDQYDLMYMMFLAKLSPFSPPGQNGLIYMECAKILRVQLFVLRVSFTSPTPELRKSFFLSLLGTCTESIHFSSVFLD